MCDCSAPTKRILFAIAGVITFVLWTIQLLNAVTIDYRNGSMVADTVNPGAMPGQPALNGNIYFSVIPLVLLTGLVAVTLVRWFKIGSKNWIIVHIVAAAVVIVVSIIVIIALSIVFLVDNKWQNSAKNMAADERLCCIKPSFNSTVDPVVPGCPVLFNNCSPDYSGLTNADMHWNSGFIWLFVLLFVDMVVAALHIALTYWVGVSKYNKGVYYSVNSVNNPELNNMTIQPAVATISLRSLGTSAAISNKQRTF